MHINSKQLGFFASLAARVEINYLMLVEQRSLREGIPFGKMLDEYNKLCFDASKKYLRSLLNSSDNPDNDLSDITIEDLLK